MGHLPLEGCCGTSSAGCWKSDTPAPMRPTSNNNNNNNITPAEHCAPTQDRERGVVWEETIIFLQDDVKMVRLRVCVCVCTYLCMCVGPDH